MKKRRYEELDYKFVRLKFLIRKIQTGSTPSTKEESYFDGNINWFTPGDFNDYEELANASKTITEKAIHDNESRLFEANTVTIVGIGATLGKVSLLKESGSFNQQITGINTKSLLNPKFLWYWLSVNRDFVFKTANYTTLPIINNQFIKELECPFPGIELQNNIVHYLNKSTDEIKALISKKEKMINLLEQQRQSIITEAVTKGLNPNVKTKDSGVEWMGDIPEHYEKTLIKYISDINMGQSPSSEYVNVLGDGIPFLQGNAEFGEFYPTPKLFCTSINKQSKLNDILLSVRAPVGAMNISNQVFGIGRGLCAITPKIEMKFLWYWLIGYNEYLKSFSTGSTFEAVSTDDIKNLIICVPQKNEQIEIVCFLDYKIGQMDNVIKQLKNQIEKLKEYRQSLIYEAVTGKIDVRDMELD